MRDDDDDKQKKQKWKMEIRSWMGLPKLGEWVGESIATDIKRVFEKHTHGAESTKAKPVIVKVLVEELVYAHSGYRPRFEGESKTRKAFFYRGARIWRENSP